MTDLAQVLIGASWPQARAAEALQSLGRAARLAPRGRTDARPQGHRGRGSSTEGRALGARIAAAAGEVDLEVDRVEAPYAEAEDLLRRAAPALLRLVTDAGETRLLALLDNGPRPLLLAPDGRRTRCDGALLRDAWCRPLERHVEPHITPMLDATELTGTSRARARRALLREHLAAVPVGGAWLLRLPPGRPLLELARRARLLRLVFGAVLSGLLASALALAAWVPLARGLFAGRLEPAWVVAWVLLLLSVLPLRWLESWLQALFGLRFGRVLRRRLMAGATRLDPDAVRGEGAGSLLGRVLESEALEALLLSGGFVLLGASVDVGLAAWVLTQGPAPALSVALFAIVVGVTLALAWHYRHRAQEQAAVRLAMTHDLVERMTGKRTRVVQERREDLHLEEDRWLSEYLERSRKLDRVSLLLTAGATGLWLLLGTFGLSTGLVAEVSDVQLAIGVGAVLLGTQALVRLAGGLAQLAACAVAWRQVKPVYAAAREREDVGLPREELRPGDAGNVGAEPEQPSAALLSARDLAYRHARRERDTLSAVDFELRRGDRVLVEGPSGGGKSTLISLITGVRRPRTGSLTLRGLDRSSHGALRWRRQVAAAPQFHENHVFGATFAFNLLLASPEYAEDAEASSETALGDGPLERRAEARALEVCRELGLDEVLERMPSGLRQNLGETGWQLSHGERSRLFLARALLADAPVVVLDESLAALDPITARRVLECIDRRCDVLVVAAHP